MLGLTPDQTNNLFAFIVALPFLFAFLWFGYNVYNTVAINAKFIGAPKAASISRTKTREEILAELPEMTRPPHIYALAHNELTAEDVGTEGIPDILQAFEFSIIHSASEDISLIRLSGADPSGVSLVVISQATFLTRFVAWLTVEKRGHGYAWCIWGSEIRSMRTPDEGNSHFQYHAGHEHRLYNSIFHRQGDDTGLFLIWDLLTGNVMTASSAHKAKAFQAFLVHRFDDALTGVQSRNKSFMTIPPPVSPILVAPKTGSPETMATETQTLQRKRPERRD